MKRIANIIVGFPTLFLLLSILFGDPQKALSLILVSIICTAGFGLLIWIPLSVIVGGMILAFAHSLSEKVSPQPISHATKASIVSSHQRALIDYLTQTTGSGYGEKEVVELLKKKGWTEKDITEALAQVKRTYTTPTTQDTFTINSGK